LALLCGFAGTASAARGWQPAVSLPGPAADPASADAPSAAMNGAGDAIVAWAGADEDANTEILVAVRRAGGAFSAPRLVSRVPLTREARSVVVAMDERGAAIVAWRLDAFNRRSVVQAAALSIAGPVSPPMTLSRRADPSLVKVAVSAAGDAIVGWARQDRSGKVVQVSTRAAGSGLSRPVSLSAIRGFAGQFDLAMNAAGDAVVAWSRRPLRRNGVVQATVRRAGRGFSRPVAVSRGTTVTETPTVAIDAAGDAIVAWERFDRSGTHDVVQVAIQAAGQAFSAPAGLSARSREARLGDVAMDAAGDAVAVWTDGRPGREPLNGVVRAAIRSAGAGFTQPIVLARAGSGAFVAMNPAGAAIVTWAPGTSSFYYVPGALVALRAPGGPFSPPALIAHGRIVGAYGAQPIAISGSGDAILAWRSYRSGVVQAATYTEATR
jgi:hypothetical protein